MRVIGLTGGIASGKSTVASILEDNGFIVIDADQLAREIVEPGKHSYLEIVKEFGADILNNDLTIDRKKLGSIVFSSEEKRKSLERITHPAIGMLADKKLADLEESGEEVVFYMAPLLIEAGVTNKVEEMWVVYVDKNTQLHRILARDGISFEEACQRVAAQMPMEEKIKFGRIIIDNNGEPNNTRQMVMDIIEREFGIVPNK
jgi:dephospho-CoA kinase